MITTDQAVFREALPEGGRLIGLDVGTKTIGTALADAGWSFASPALLIRRTKFTADKAEIAALIAQQLVVGIVIGLPLNLDGSDSPRTQSTRAPLASRLPQQPPHQPPQAPLLHPRSGAVAPQRAPGQGAPSAP
jgi:hypothetical protein